MEWLLTTELLDELHLMEGTDWSVFDLGGCAVHRTHAGEIVEGVRGSSHEKVPRHVDADQRRGYCRLDFEDMWDSYVPEVPTNEGDEECP